MTKRTGLVCPKCRQPVAAIDPVNPVLSRRCVAISEGGQAECRREAPRRVELGGEVTLSMQRDPADERREHSLYGGRSLTH